MVLRIVAKLGERAGENPETLALLAQVADAVNVALTAGARGSHYGEAAASWSHIGAQLGISKQAAAQRFAYERPER